MPKRWSQFELAVLSSLYRIEQRQGLIIQLIKAGPVDPQLVAELAKLEQSLDTAGNDLKAAVEAANQPSQP